MKLIEQDPAMISHKELAVGRWNTFSLMEQLAHIGSEIQRTINAKRRGYIPVSHAALVWGLELLALIVNVRCLHLDADIEPNL